MTEVIKCDCKNKYQDEKYGKGMRVFNWAEKKQAWRCTVCKKEKSGKTN